MSLVAYVERSIGPDALVEQLRRITGLIVDLAGDEPDADSNAVLQLDQYGEGFAVGLVLSWTADRTLDHIEVARQLSIALKCHLATDLPSDHRLIGSPSTGLLPIHQDALA